MSAIPPNQDMPILDSYADRPLRQDGRPDDSQVQAMALSPAGVAFPSFGAATTSTTGPSITHRDVQFDPADQFALITSFFSERFDAMERKLLKSPPKEENKFTYKGKSNKIQGEFNHELKKSITETRKLLEGTGGLATKRPISILQDVEARLENRIKLIKIADTSIGGWSTVEQYETKSVGDDSDDEKKIRAAERRALAAKKTTPATNRYQSAFRPYMQNRYTNYRASLPSQQHSRFVSSNTITRPYPTFRVAKPTDICLQCGGKGHWRKDCTSALGTAKGKTLDSRYETFPSFILTTGGIRSPKIAEF